MSLNLFIFPPYQELLRSKNPQAVVSRFERGNFTHDEECWQHYIAALAQTGHSEAILPKVLQRLETAGAGRFLIKSDKSSQIFFRLIYIVS